MDGLFLCHEQGPHPREPLTDRIWEGWPQAVCLSLDVGSSKDLQTSVLGLSTGVLTCSALQSRKPSLPWGETLRGKPCEQPEGGAVWWSLVGREGLALCLGAAEDRALIRVSRGATALSIFGEMLVYSIVLTNLFKVLLSLRRQGPTGDIHEHPLPQGLSV